MALWVLAVCLLWLSQIAKQKGKQVSIHLYGQEINPETYAIAIADMILKGKGETSQDNFIYGSTLSSDGLADKTFDFMLSNPPYGKSWKTDAEKMGGKSGIKDPRFVIGANEDEQQEEAVAKKKKAKNSNEFSMLSATGDGQLLFLLNNISKMKESTDLGSRIVEVHNGSSLFTGDAGQGESNARRHMIERDLVEAIIALPEGMFYNTGIATFIWVLSNRKEERRRGKIQLIDATSMKAPLRKNLGKKNCEFTPEIRQQILDLYFNMEENEYSKIFPNSEFGFYKVEVLQPKLDEQGQPLRDKKGKFIEDKNKKDSEIIPLRYKGGIEAFLDKEVRPFAPYAYVNEAATKIGYKLSFTKYFYKPIQLRPLAEIVADIRALEAETAGLLEEIIGEEA